MRLLSIALLVLSSLCCEAQHSAKCAHRTANGSTRIEYLNQENLRSDTLDVLHYNLYMDFTQFLAQQLRAKCTVLLKAKMDNIALVNLDLQGLTVDSITGPNGSLLFNHISPLLTVHLPAPIDSNETVEFTVHYRGNPEQDETWGGAYFSLGYAYNMGVAFSSTPHNFGRVWHPCFDNFVERSTYEFHVLTANSRSAYCNGTRTGVESAGADSLLTHWEMHTPIPSYLANYAVSNYVHSATTFEGTTQDVPVWLVSTTADSSEMKQSFQNLHPWLHALEEHYGPQRFERIGFVGVPFNAGAMEHATNISYPLSAYQNGSLASETLYAHEMAHHWWGDNTTCRTPEDMWLNEGWASYSEALFQESIYGQDAYQNYVRTNHKDVLLRAHQQDGGHYPVSGVPSELTYGSHVYNKGADMVHNLRKTMGDENFFDACRQFQEAFQEKDINTEDLRDFFQNYTTRDLTAFMNQWIYASGFPELRVARMTVSNGEANLRIDQVLRYAPEFYIDMPVNVHFVDAQMNRVDRTVIVSESSTEVSVALPADFVPVDVWLNHDESINMAVLGENKWINATGVSNFSYAEMDANVEQAGSSDSSLVRIESHWANAAGQLITAEFTPSTDRWWSVHLPSEDGLVLSGTLRYYGNSASNIYYDLTFFEWMSNEGLTEDSLLLLYRAPFTDEWNEYVGSYVLNTQGSVINGTGRFEIDTLRAGDYCWGVRRTYTSLNTIPVKASNKAWFSVDGNEMYLELAHDAQLLISDAQGKEIFRGTMKQGRQTLPCASWASGVYSIFIRTNESALTLKRIKS